jgi:hypothetical protein
MSKKRTVETAHGSFDYETVTCPNCESEVAAEEAVSVVLNGRVTERWSYNDSGKIEGAGSGDANTSTSDGSDTSFTEACLCVYCADAVFGYAGEVAGVSYVDQIDRHENVIAVEFGVSKYHVEGVICALGIVALSAAFVAVTSQTPIVFSVMALLAVSGMLVAAVVRALWMP